MAMWKKRRSLPFRCICGKGFAKARGLGQHIKDMPNKEEHKGIWQTMTKRRAARGT